MTRATRRGRGQPPRATPLKDRMRSVRTFARVATSRGLTVYDQAVWFHLWVRAYWPDDVVTLSALRIAELSNISEREVKRAIGRLAEARFLVVTTRGGLGRGPSTYRLYAAPFEGAAVRAGRPAGRADGHPAG